MGSQEEKYPERSSEQLRQHYLVEKELAARLRTAPKEARGELYSSLYDELFRRVPDHPQLTGKVDQQQRQKEAADRLLLLDKFLTPETVYLEIGPGDCSLAIEVAKRAHKVFAVDVSHEIARDVPLPQNLELVISDGCAVPVPSGSVDVAYSDQLMEHLHPDDAFEQLKNVYEALRPGGVYICITPNQMSGPHDISRNFDEVATGFHLQEYTASDLDKLLRQVGFRRVKFLVGARSLHVTMPFATLKCVESFLQTMPRRLSKRLARGLPLRLILGVKLIAWK